MNWILIPYLLCLVFLSTRTEDQARRNSLRAAWVTFALIPFSEFLMHLFRAGNIRDVRAMQLIEVWDQALPSLLLGISFLCLRGALVPDGPSSASSEGVAP